MLSCAAGALAQDHAYDRDNQFGAVSIDGRDQPLFPMFDRAQQLGAVTVNDRDRPNAQPQGIRRGTYLIFPVVGATTMWDDNVLRSQKKEGDLRSEAMAAVKFESHLPRHLLDFMFSGRFVSFANHGERNYADGAAAMRTRIDIDHGHALVGNFVTRLDHEERRDGETPITAKRPVEYWQSQADVGFVRSVGRLTTLVGANAEHKEFRDVDAWDGSKLDQRFRDTDIWSAYTKLRYQISPGYAVTGRVSAIKEENRGNATFNRSNRGFEVLAGVDFEPSRLLRASLEGGYTQRDYDQQSLADINTAIFEGRLAWLITPLVTIYLKGRRTVSQTSFAGASGRVDNLFSASIEYEPLRKLVLTANAEYTAAEYNGTSRRDDVLIGRLGAQYFLSKHLLLTLNYEHERLTSNVAGFSYDDNKIMAGLKVRY